MSCVVGLAGKWHWLSCNMPMVLGGCNIDNAIFLSCPTLNLNYYFAWHKKHQQNKDSTVLLIR